MANQKNRGNGEKAKESGRTFKAGKVLRRKLQKEADRLHTLRASTPPGTYSQVR